MAKTKKTKRATTRTTRSSIERDLQNDPFVRKMVVLFSALSIVYLWVAFWRYG